MAIRRPAPANGTPNGAAQTPPAQPAQPAQQQAPVQTLPAQQAPAQTPPPARPAPTPPAQPPAQAPQAQVPAAPAQGGGNMAMMDFHNQGGEVVLEGFDEWNGGNFVTVDGSDFYNKSTETRVREMNIIISYARQYYRWFDRDNNEWHEAPNKVDKRYSLAAEIRWMDWVEGEEEPKEFTLTIATTSAIQFREYIKNLRDNGIRINNIWTRLSIERLQRTDPETKEVQRYSRVKFDNAGPVQYE